MSKILPLQNNMGKIRKISIGDVFAIKIENTDYYYFGRILFDVKEQYKEKIENHNYLGWHGKSVLIETYKTISKTPEISEFKVILNGTFVPKKTLLSEDITIIKNIPVNHKKVSFPEVFQDVHMTGILFSLGELTILTSFDTKYVDKTKVFPTLGNMYYIQLATLDYSGRRDLIEYQEDIIDNYFRDSDLRSFPEIRKEIYKDIGEDPNMSYYELALKHGFDLARFY
ncbi:Imm26 family immunity protein [Cellulophaga sp. L1A9]|uniref:Imm26 family immunity protein n=1 Tax=Cellulophaga sp. L1A9 TaxID=2686362 RepID=UPI00131A8394|nr:Imm26 family immunity protein [Cellulophaga sp. L1A9]